MDSFKDLPEEARVPVMMNVIDSNAIRISKVETSCVISSVIDPIFKVGINTSGDYGYLKWGRGSDELNIGTQAGGDTITIGEDKKVGR